MTEPLLVMPLDGELAVVAVRRRAREVSEALAFTLQDQTRIATSVLEVARTVLGVTREGRAEFLLDDAAQPRSLLIRFVAPATSIDQLTPRPVSGVHAVDTDTLPHALGVLAAQRLMDGCSFEAVAGNALVTLEKRLPDHAGRFAGEAVAALARRVTGSNTGNSFDEVQRQNRELVNALGDLQERQEELGRLTRELEDTNRGVVALYAELDERADHLRRADDAKSRFLSNMSHEFRSPLYSIRALSKLLIDRADGELTDEQAKQVKFIRKAAEELSETVDDLLDIAKIEAGKIELRPSEFEVANLFSALRGMLRPLVPAAGVDLFFDPCGDIPAVYTDEGKVAQILRNFISNALKFTEHGEVRVGAHYDAAQQLLTFSVSDTGIGIAPEHQQSVFEEFEQVENRLQAYVKGTGLGLPLCSKLCKLLGGTVGLRSELGKGSTFTATIQAYLPRVAGAPERAAVLQDAERATVLLVASEAGDRFDYEASLHNTRYRAATAATVREARAVVEVAAPAVLVIDTQPGHEEGWTWLAELRHDETNEEADDKAEDKANDKAAGLRQAAHSDNRGRTDDLHKLRDPHNRHTRRIPVIMLSSIDERSRARHLGADAFFIKPLSGSELLMSLDAMLGGH
jgi:signal transduction histidine kinase/CheY-like chemotaxis protein